MVVGEAGLPSLGHADGNAGSSGELGQLRGGRGVDDPSAGDDQWPFGGADYLRGAALGGAVDAVPVLGDRLERIVGGVIPGEWGLELLQHRPGTATREDIAG